jgi:seryl-tRNA synthetase
MGFSMELSQLQAQINKLQAQVTAHTTFDQAQADQIRQQVAAISASLDDLTSEHDEPLNDQLTRIAAEFEADYPQTSRVLERMADTLSKLGI